MLLDKLDHEITEGSIIVYPSRPGGHGPLQLVKARVDSVQPELGEITVVPEGSNQPLKIRRYERVAVVGHAVHNSY